MIKVWILTLILSSNGSNISTQQYQFSTQNECLKARDYAKSHSGYVDSGFCLLTEKP